MTALYYGSSLVAAATAATVDALHSPVTVEHWWQLLVACVSSGLVGALAKSLLDRARSPASEWRGLYDGMVQQLVREQERWDRERADLRLRIDQLEALVAGRAGGGGVA